MKKLLFVVGMHRSGTSCLTGLLGDAGVWLGPVETGSPHNKKGNNENRQVMNLNKAVLAANDASWLDPTPGDAVWSNDHVATADLLLADLLAEGRITAMKDPRNLFTGQGWRERAEAAGAEIAYVGTFRRVDRVVASLTARDPGLDAEHCTRLWEQYNRRLIELHDVCPFPVVNFDLSPSLYLESVRGAFTTLGLTPPEELEFFENGLRHQTTGDEDTSSTDAVYADLLRRAVVAG